MAFAAIYLDLKSELRQVRRSPVLTAVAVASIMLSIGATTGAYSVINALYFRHPQVRNPEALVLLRMVTPDATSEDDTVPYKTFRGLQRALNAFSDMFAWDDESLRSIEADGFLYAGSAIEVSGEYFEALGVRPNLGRLIAPSDTSASGYSRIAVLDYGCWKQHFKSDAGVLGRSVKIDGIPLRIVGVTPPNFHHLDVDTSPDVTIPIGFDSPDLNRESYRVAGHLRPGYSLSRARSEVSTIAPGLLEEGVTLPPLDPQQKTKAPRILLDAIPSGLSTLRSQVSRPSQILLPMLGVAILLTAINLAIVQLSRAFRHRRELAVRIAMGASLRDIILQHLILSSAIVICGAALSLLWCFAISGSLIQLLWMGRIPLTLNTEPDLVVWVVLIGAVVAVAAGSGITVSFGLARLVPETYLRSHIGVTSRRSHARNVLICVQIILTCVLTFYASSFAGTLMAIYSIDPGYNTGNVMCLNLFPQPGKPRIIDRPAYYRSLSAAILGVPGVSQVTYSFAIPGSGRDIRELASFSEGGHASMLPVATAVVGPGFFQTFGVSVSRGREFAWTDTDASEPSAVISRSLADSLFPGGTAVGQIIHMTANKRLTTVRVIGVVENARFWRLQDAPPLAIYTDFLQDRRLNQPTLSIRSDGRRLDPMALGNAVTKMGQHYISRAKPLTERIARTLNMARIVAELSVIFSGLAILLAGMGVYGVISEKLSAQRREMAIRVALGARSVDVFRVLLVDMMWVIALSVVASVPISVLSTRIISPVEDIRLPLGVRLLGVRPRNHRPNRERLIA